MTKKLSSVRFADICSGDDFYNANIESWRKFNLAYEGGSGFVSEAITRNPIESVANHQIRVREGYYFNYPATVIGLYAFAIMEQEPKSEYGKLASDEQWLSFCANCDLFGTDLKDFIDRAQVVASINGSCGVLVNKPPSIGNGQTRQYEIDNGIYPYLTLYDPSNILEAEFLRNSVSHKVELVYLRVRDIDGRIQEWTKERIVVYQKIQSSIVTSSGEVVNYDRTLSNANGGVGVTGSYGGGSFGVAEGDVTVVGQSVMNDISSINGVGSGSGYGVSSGSVTGSANRVDFEIVFNGSNDLGEIPFYFMRNLGTPGSLRKGLSDLREIAPIAESVVRNASIGEEIFKFAGFPMMRKPKLEEGDEDPDESGVSAILEFDPEHGDGGKPDWLKPEVRESIVSLLEWIDRKVDEIYRVSFLSGMHNQAKGTQVRSGVALRYELKQLTSILTQKTKGLSELEYAIARLWLKWQNKIDLLKDVVVSRPIEFTMDELVENVGLLKDSLEYISSDKYNKQAQMRIIQLLIPGLSKRVIESINNEIYSTRKENLSVKLKDTNDRTFGVVHTSDGSGNIVKDGNAVKDSKDSNAVKDSNDVEDGNDVNDKTEKNSYK